MAKFYSEQLQKGSKGDETKKWQEFLNTQGYGLAVDGDFGQKTYDATIAYQKANGLGADGIVGEKTWGKAGYSNLNNPLSAPESTPFEYDEYTESESVTQARQDKTNADNAVENYGDFSYGNQSSLDEIMNKILNREEFSYDLNGDALYQQYKDKYIQQGKMAMQDTMGQASAMTGGYGNSYAATVGNQAYQASLENLNDIVPELWQMAYDRYNQEGQELYNQYGVLTDDRNTQYGMWSDQLNQLKADRTYYANLLDSERNFDYGTYSDDRNLAYNTHRDSIEDAQWKTEFDEALRQHEQGMALTREQWDWQKAQASASGSGSSGGGSGGSGGSGGKGSGSGSGSSDTGSSTTPTSGVPKSVINGLNGKKTNQAKEDYLWGLVEDGTITEDQMNALYADNRNTQADLKDRKWTQVDDGGVNWFWGVDNNAKVKDQYGNVYRLDDLVDALVKEGMSKKAAKEFVKKYN